MVRVKHALIVLSMVSCIALFYFVYNILPGLVKVGKYVASISEDRLISSDGKEDYVHGEGGLKVFKVL